MYTNFQWSVFISVNSKSNQLSSRMQGFIIVLKFKILYKTTKSDEIIVKIFYPKSEVL